MLDQVTGVIGAGTARAAPSPAGAHGGASRRQATVIVEAGETSGTVHQGWEALRLGRLLFLLESVAQDSNLSWPAKMIHYGAHVLTRDNLSLFVENVPSMTVRAAEGLAAYT